ncbi:hypothetical protein PybrP1_011371 [[Pythium] brassicae (nom. inval.)]|nr:hypothetical protein PybrP1_011371 [[Pythium] brassicae (nom. inval.)]
MASAFGLRESNLFGGMSDAGSDVKWMLSAGLGLQCEWRLAHLMNAATKHAFGLESKATTKNTDMTELVANIRITVRTVKEVEATDTLFQALCQLEGKDKTVGLLTFQVHCLLGLVRALEHLLDLWEPLKRWFTKRAETPSNGWLSNGCWMAARTDGLLRAGCARRRCGRLFSGRTRTATVRTKAVDATTLQRARQLVECSSHRCCKCLDPAREITLASVSQWTEANTDIQRTHTSKAYLQHTCSFKLHEERLETQTEITKASVAKQR